MIGAATFNTATYEDVEKDENATTQALLVVVIVAIAAAIGSLRAGLGLALFSLVFAVIGWVLGSVVAYYVGITLFRSPQMDVTIGQVLRTIGFAQSPRVLSILSIIPIIGVLVSIILFFWLIVTYIMALKAAFDFDTAKAVVTAIVTAVVIFVIQFVLGVLLIGGAMLGGAI
jgi:hypothetical protein